MLCYSRIYNTIFITYFVTHTAYFRIFNIFTNKREVSHFYVLAPECHLQGVYEHKVQHSTSGINRPNCHP
jgi:hypothetical protein